MLIGLQLPSIVASLSRVPAGRAARLGRGDQPDRHRRPHRVGLPGHLPAAPAAAPRIRARDPYPPPRAVFVVSWAGMRGAVSLAAALALPLDADPFPDRDLVIFLTFCVIVATLVGQGLTLPWLVRRLGVIGDDRAGHGGVACPADRGRGGARPAGRPRAASTRATWSWSTSCASRYEHEAGHVCAARGRTARRVRAGAARPPRDPQRGPRRRARGRHRACATTGSSATRCCSRDRARPRPRGAPLRGLRAPGGPC